jgi:hypothetical protein
MKTSRLAWSMCVLTLVTGVARAETSADREKLKTYFGKLAEHPPEAHGALAKLAPAPKSAATKAADHQLRVGITNELVVGPGNLTPQGSKHGQDVAAFVKALVELRDKVRAKNHGDQPGVMFDIDDGAPWSLVVAVMQKLAPLGFIDDRLRFSLAATAPPFANSPIDEQVREIAKLDIVAKAEALAKLSQQVFGGCKRAMEAMTLMATVAPEARPPLVLRLLVKVLDDATCHLDPPSVQMWAIAMYGDVQIMTSPLRLDPKGKVKVAAASSATWGDVVRDGKLDAAVNGKTSVRFVAAP